MTAYDHGAAVAYARTIGAAIGSAFRDVADRLAAGDGPSSAFPELEKHYRACIQAAAGHVIETAIRNGSSTSEAREVFEAFIVGAGEAIAAHSAPEETPPLVPPME